MSRGRGGWRQFFTVGLPAVGISVLGSVILSRFMLAKNQIKDKTMPATAESQFEAKMREQIAAKHVKLEEEYEKMKNQLDLSSWEPVPVPRPKDEEGGEVNVDDLLGSPNLTSPPSPSSSVDAAFTKKESQTT